MKIIYEIARQNHEFGTISVSISPYNFEKSYALFLQLAASCFDNLATWIHLRLNDNYKYVTAVENCAALLLEAPEWFSLSKTRVGSFDCNKLGLHFSVFAYSTGDYVLGIYYDAAEIATGSIAELVSRLCEMKMIYKSGGANNA